MDFHRFVCVWDPEACSLEAGARMPGSLWQPVAACGGGLDPSNKPLLEPGGRGQNARQPVATSGGLWRRLKPL